MTKVSVIIPTYNEANVIMDCLKSLDKQSLKDFEVIVIDDGSTDLTLSQISNLQFTIYNLQILTQNHKGPGAARNLGANSAAGEILVFVDADMTFEKNFLKNLIKPILLNKTKGTFSKDENVSNWNNIWSRCWNINEGWESNRRHKKNYPDLQPVFRAILKSEFDKVGGFDPGGYDDDWTLYKKLGYLATTAPNAIFFHKNPDTLADIFKHAKWVGKRNYKMGKLGYIIALVRASLPVSILVGIWKSVINFNLYFFIFKIVYDFGIFIGIVALLFSGKAYK